MKDPTTNPQLDAAVEEIRTFVKKLENEYHINADGIVTSPGKFEAEHVATLWYYEIVMNGGSNPVYHCDKCPTEVTPDDICGECHDFHDEFEISAAEKIVFPHLKNKTHFTLTYRSDGFVIGGDKA